MKEIILIFLLLIASDQAYPWKCSHVMAKNFELRNARLADMDEIKRLYNRYRWQIPFIVRDAIETSIRKREIKVVVEKSDGIVGVIRWYKRLDGWQTVHEVVVSEQYQRMGLGKILMDEVPKPRRVTCPVENEIASWFYFQLGLSAEKLFTNKRGTELLVWEDR